MSIPRLWLSVTLLLSSPATAQLQADQFAALRVRNIGPAGMSGRVAAIEVVPGDPSTLYVGGATGGVWKSADGGVTWTPIFDDQPASSIGDISTFPGNPDIVWVATGEGNPRNSAGVGRGVFRSLDGGMSWTAAGLDHSERIHRIVPHPTDPETAWAGVMGPSWSDGEERGVFKTTDAGRTWRRVLFANPRTGASDLVIDPHNPNTLYAGLWEHRRQPWFFESGGAGSGLYVSRDGGETWMRLTPANGLPTGPLGRIGLAAAAGEPGVVYALVEASESALLRSDDYGRSWRTIRSGPGTAPRPFYYTDIRVDPANENRIYNLHSRIEVSEDQGRTFRTVVPSARIHGDVQDLWIGPTGRLLVMGNDGGVGISYDRGATWRFVENLPLAQFYHINVDMDIPYNVYGGLQDNGSWFGPAAPWFAGGIRNYYWRRVGGGDGFATMTDFSDPRYGFTMSQQGNLRRFDKLTGERRDIRPTGPEGTPLRFNWNAGFAVDPFDSTVIYIGSQFLHRSTNQGRSWEIVSPDLTTNDPAKQRAAESGGLTRDASGAENHTTIITIAPSPVERGVIWVGTDDGNVQITRDGGTHWTNVVDRIPNVPAGTWVSHIEASKFDGAAAFAVFDDHRRGNWTPYVYVTHDYGRHWRSLATDALDGFVHVLEQDPVEPTLLFLGTEFSLYVSFDDGGHWMRWTHDLPTAPYRALIVHPRDHDLVIGTHGRAAWVLDDIRPLRAMAADPALSQARLHLFSPSVAYQHTVAESMTGGYRSSGDAMFSGTNRPYGALLTYWVADSTGGRVTMNLEDDTGRTVRTLHDTPEPGANRVVWNLRETGFRTPAASGTTTTPGPEVLPGRYTVRAFRESDTSTTSLEIRFDPRVEVPAADRRARHRALRDVGGWMEVAEEMLTRIRTMDENVRRANDVLTRQDTEGTTELRSAGDTLRSHLDAIRNRVVNRAGRGPGLRDTRGLLVSRLRGIYGSLQSSWEGPTATQRRVMAEVRAAAAAMLTDFNREVEGDFARYRDGLGALGFRIVDPVDTLSITWTRSDR